MQWPWYKHLNTPSQGSTGSAREGDIAIAMSWFSYSYNSHSEYDLPRDFFDGILLENSELVIFPKLPQIHFHLWVLLSIYLTQDRMLCRLCTHHVIIEVKDEVRAVVWPGAKAEVAHLRPPGPVAVGDAFAQNLRQRIMEFQVEIVH